MTKITLATLPQATEQEVFNQVASHLLTQNRQSLREGSSSLCMYKGVGGLQCAAGCLIGDGEYKEEMEEQPWETLTALGWVPEEHEELIKTFQDLHDNYLPKFWRRELSVVAKHYNLDSSILGQLETQP